MSEEDPKQALDNLSKKTAILLALCASPFFYLFVCLGDPGRGRAAAICAFVILLCARIFWSLRRHVLFWVALMIVALLHIPLILRIEWGNRNYPGVALLPLAFLDFCIVYGALKLVEKVTKRSSQSTDTTLGA
jgi:hypothetical protein